MEISPATEKRLLKKIEVEGCHWLISSELDIEVVISFCMKPCLLIVHFNDPVSPSISTAAIAVFF